MPNSRGQFAEGAQLRFVENRDDQQDGVGADGGGFEDVVFGDGEILADDGQVAGGAGGLRDRVGALEEIAIGEDGERGRAALFILLREFGGAEILDQNASAGRSFLDFGDDGGAFGAQCSAAAKSRRSGRADSASWRNSAAGCFGAQLFPFAGHNTGEDVGGCRSQVLS